MAIYKRGGIWWLDFTRPNGKRVRRTTGTADKRQAQELHDRLRSQAWRQDQLKEGPRRTWPEAVERYLRTHEGPSRKTTLGHLRRLDPFLGKLHLDEIDRDLLDSIADDLRDGREPATVNRHLEVVRAVLRQAQAAGWLKVAPSFQRLAEPTRRVRFLTPVEAHRLLNALPAHLRGMAAFTLATGLRERNVTHLDWSQVDLPRKTAWIHANQAKTRKAYPVPLNADALRVLKAQPTKEGRVFRYKGEPVDRCNGAAWRKALVRAGIKDFRWHDLRHTWASWAVQAGVPLNALMELGGWTSLAMVTRYAHFDSSDLTRFASQIRHR